MILSFTADMPLWLTSTIFGLIALSLYCAVAFVHRIYFSPLRNVPGPKLAIATSWQVVHIALGVPREQTVLTTVTRFETYHDLVQGGGKRWPWRLSEMYDKYGMFKAGNDNRKGLLAHCGKQRPCRSSQP